MQAVFHLKDIELKFPELQDLLNKFLVFPQIKNNIQLNT